MNQMEQETIIFYGTKEVAACLGCSFPLIKVGKNLRVQKAAFEKWASERRV